METPSENTLLPDSSVSTSANVQPDGVDNVDQVDKTSELTQQPSYSESAVATEATSKSVPTKRSFSSRARSLSCPDPDSQAEKDVSHKKARIGSDVTYEKVFLDLENDIMYNHGKKFEPQVIDGHKVYQSVEEPEIWTPTRITKWTIQSYILSPKISRSRSGQHTIELDDGKKYTMRDKGPFSGLYTIPEILNDDWIHERVASASLLNAASKAPPVILKPDDPDIVESDPRSASFYKDERSGEVYSHGDLYKNCSFEEHTVYVKEGGQLDVPKGDCGKWDAIITTYITKKTPLFRKAHYVEITLGDGEKYTQATSMAHPFMDEWTRDVPLDNVWQTVHVATEKLEESSDDDSKSKKAGAKRKTG